MRRLVVAATASVAVAAGLITAPTAVAATYAKTAVTIQTHVGPDEATSCTIEADLYVPDSATTQSKQPAILTTHGFGGSKADQEPFARMLAQRDYVVLAYSGLGFGGSQCKIHLDDPDWDGKAASQLVDYLAGLDVVALDAEGDPKVGMFGGSYGGAVQFAAAKDDQRIDALIPVITWNNLEYALDPNNADFEEGVTPDTYGVFKRVWADLFAVFGALRGLEYGLGDPRRLVGCPNFVDQVCPTIIQANVLGYATAEGRALLRHASVASFIDEIKTPTLLIQGQDDTLFNLQEAIATYRGLKDNGTPVRMIWQSWGHSGAAPAEGEFDPSMTRDPETTYLGRRVLDWFARWLRDDDSKQLGPEVAYFRDWIQYDGSQPAGAEPAYGTANQYPVGNTQKLYLSGNRTLTPDGNAIVAGKQTYANLPAGVPSSYSELPPFDLDVAPFDLPGSAVAWTTAPLRENVHTVGVPTLDVKLTSPVASLTQLGGTGGQLVLFAKIYDVAPDGKLSLVDRLVSPARVPDVNQPVRVELPGVVHRYAQGHRIRVVLAASDSAYGGNLSVLPVTVKTAVGSVPVLTLPVSGDGRVG